MKIKTQNIFQVVEVTASPKEVYNTFMNPVSHSKFTGKSAEMAPIEGGKFAFCNKNHTGTFLKLTQGKKIVLAWTHRKFPKNHYSIVDITFTKAENGNTRISMNHLGVPESCDGWLTDGWRKTYWEPLSEYFKQPEMAMV